MRGATNTLKQAHCKSQNMMLKPRFSRASTFYNLLLSLPLVSYLHLLIFFLNDLWFNIHPPSNTSHLTVPPIMSKFLVWCLTNFKWILSKYCTSNFNCSAYSKFVLWNINFEYRTQFYLTNVPVVDKKQKRERKTVNIPKRERVQHMTVLTV